jgi:hypothetical protein
VQASGFIGKKELLLSKWYHTAVDLPRQENRVGNGSAAMLKDHILQWLFSFIFQSNIARTPSLQAGFSSSGAETFLLPVR